MKNYATLLLFYLSFSILTAQEPTNLQAQLNELFTSIEQELYLGHLSALKDIAELLDDQRPFLYSTGHGSATTEVRNIALGQLAQHVEFTQLNITDTLNTQAFLNFLNEHGDRIFYSPLIQKFTDRPLKDRPIDYRIRDKREEIKKVESLQEIKQEIADLLRDESYYAITQAIERAGALGTEEAFQFLKECAEGMHWGKGKNERENQVYSSICFALQHFKNIEAVKIILDLLKNHQVYSEADCIIALSRITNIDLVAISEKEINIVESYRDLLDSLPNIDQLVQAGYEMTAAYRPYEFDSDFEYYAQLVLDSRDFWWLNEHAIYDLLASKDHRALKFIGTQLKRGTFFYNDYTGREFYNIVDIMEKATGVTLEVKDRNGTWGSQYRDPLSKTNYAAYWVQHYDDYKWSEEKNRFIYTKEVLNPDELSGMFERLSHPNKKTAIAAFLSIIEQEPTAVEEKLKQYDLFSFGSMNSALSSFSNRFIPQLTRLTQFCRGHQIDYHLSQDWIDVLDSLNNFTNDAERYLYEDHLIDQISLADLTPLEIYMITCESVYWDANHALSRMLDKWYSKNWDQITSDPLQIRLYLKKAWHFDHLGIIGNINKYVLKFNNAEEETLQLLEELIEKETDDKIRSKMLTALHLNGRRKIKLASAKESIPLNIDYFISALKNKLEINIRQIMLDTTTETYQKLFALLDSEDLQTIKLADQLIAQNLHISMTPFLLATTENKKELSSGYISRHDAQGGYHPIDYTILLADKMVAYLEHLHDHVFPRPIDPALQTRIVSSSYSNEANFRNRHLTANKWKELNEQTQGAFHTWPRLFFERKKEAITQTDTLTIEKLNRLLNSRFFSPSDWPILIEAFPRVIPQESLAKLSLPKKTTLPEKALPYFSSIRFEPDELDDVVNFFKGLPPEKILQALSTFVKSFTLEKKGEAYYKLMWNTDLRDWVNNGLVSDEQREVILESLRIFWQKVKDHDFEGDHALRFIEQIEGASLTTEQRLKKILKDSTKDWEETIKDLLGSIEFEELGIVLKYYDQLPLHNNYLRNYLEEDWGIPLLEPLDDKIIEELKTRLRTMAEEEIYTHYLDKTGIQYRTGEELDFDKIYNILEFDIVDGFVGGGGGRRIEHVYAIIRLLEMEFQQNLDFRKKFNDMINSYRWDTPKRARAWQSFLINNGYVKLSPHYVPGISNLKPK